MIGHRVPVGMESEKGKYTVSGVREVPRNRIPMKLHEQ